MLKFASQLTAEELSNIFNKAGYMITNLSELFIENSDYKDENYMYVHCFDLKPDPLMEQLQNFMPIICRGSYSYNYRNKIFLMDDFQIDELFFDLFDEHNTERNSQLHEIYNTYMTQRFGETYIQNKENFIDSQPIDEEDYTNN